MAEMTGGQALAQSLRLEGVEVIFGLPGVQLDWAFDALYAEREHIRFIQCRHEQASAYMADGYARTTGRPGACLVVPGPGVLNAAAALSTAYACSSPVLCVTGQIQSDLIGRNRGVLHEIPDQMRAMASVSKWQCLASEPAQIPAAIHEAFRQMGTGRARPVEIEIPPDVLAKKGEVRLAEPEPFSRGTAGDPDLIEAAARLLGEAERPLIFAGGGVIGADACAELLRLAELLEAPVAMSNNARGAISDRNYLGQPPLAGRQLLPDADVILAVGTRLVQPATLWGIKPEQKVIHIDIDPEELGRNHSPHLSIEADAKAALAELGKRAERHNRSRPSRAGELTAVKAKILGQLNDVLPQASLAAAIREELPDNGIVICGMTQVGYWSRLAFPVYEPRTFLTSGYQGTLGFEFPTALGAKVGALDRPVVAICGDGGFMYNVQELSTMAQQGINAVAIVFNDNAYGNVRRTQRLQFDGHIIGTDLHNPDFAKLAELFGVAGIRADGPEELRTALRSALSNGHPTLIEVPVEEMPSPWTL
jgi:acetolactate synthase I/II/III large subunit